MPEAKYVKRITIIIAATALTVISATAAAWATVGGTHHQQIPRAAITLATPNVVAGGEQNVDAVSGNPLYAFAIYAAGTANEAVGHIYSSPQPGMLHFNSGTVTCLEVSGSDATVTYRVRSTYRVVVVMAGTSPATAAVRFLVSDISPTSVPGCYSAPFNPAPIYAGAAQVNG
jgi:hypothetical protein